MADLTVLIQEAEIRGVEQKDGKVKDDGTKTAPFLVVRIDDTAGIRHELIDRDIENKMLYKRGTFCDIVAVIRYGFTKGGGWCRFELKSITPRE